MKNILSLEHKPKQTCNHGTQECQSCHLSSCKGCHETWWTFDISTRNPDHISVILWSLSSLIPGSSFGCLLAWFLLATCLFINCRWASIVASCVIEKVKSSTRRIVIVWAALVCRHYWKTNERCNKSRPHQLPFDSHVVNVCEVF